MRVKLLLNGLEGTVEEEYTNAYRVRWDDGTYWTVRFDEVDII